MTHHLEYDCSRPLFMLPDARFSLDEAASILTEAYAQDKPVLIYIHGRAKNVGEPRKSVEKGIYDGLENYGISVLGFTWDAASGGFDEDDAIKSVNDFDRFLNEINAFLLEHPEKNSPSLLAHSMGNIIVAELAKRGGIGTDRGKLFENIVLSAAAVRRKNHHEWLEQIGASQRTYVVTNAKDKMLKLAGLGPLPNKLGRKLKRPCVAPEQAVYVNLDHLGLNHRYFIKSGQNGHANLASFYKSALSGGAIDFSRIAVNDTIRGVPVQKIKSS
jgi:pimeloyl-ACP methyl ester carboxylesterase